MPRNRTNRTAWELGCGVAASIACLPACSGPESEPEPAADSPSAPAAETDAPAETSPSATSAPAAPAEGSPEVSAAALCEYLTGELPDLRAIGSEVGAMANLTVNLFTWYDEQGAVPKGTEIDALTQEECPEVGTEVLSLAGVESFAML